MSQTTITLNLEHLRVLSKSVSRTKDAELRKLERGDSFFEYRAACVEYVGQLLAAPVRKKESERWEVRQGGLAVETYWKRKHFPSVRAEINAWAEHGYTVSIIHITTFRTVKK